MPFTATPLVAGDAHDLAARIAVEADAEIAQQTDPATEAACLARLWSRIVELGWTAIAVPEGAGGVGGSLMDLAALAGGAGRAALPLPVAGACAVVPHLLGVAPGHPVLAAAASGEARIAAILPGAASDPGATPLTLEDGRLSGSVVGVETPPDPTHVLLVLGEALILLPSDAPGIACATSLRIDRRLTADWSFASVPALEIVARGAQVARHAEEARDLGALLTCVEATAALGALIEQTIAHLSNRVQFGAPLGTNQALRHRVAEMYVEYETLRGLVRHALRSAEEAGRPSGRDVAFAKLRLGHAGRFIAQAAIQCHGGMGMTDHLPATRLARRVTMAEHEYGDRAFQARRLLVAGH
ncbi:MAG TPA: acyl-CoA dehydrogenase family protein [Falsiroseomonas sp.]|jgi:alkylation response protein AidB-like acyl-CoA dehydrogenase|nr:acyl-CoA dehydrogenase family protein [Falsiroseomonas sp.]